MATLVELYENQRYAFAGWSASSLLPTDRYSFSTKDGMDGWSNITESENSQLSKGWRYLLGSDWTPEISDKVFICILHAIIIMVRTLKYYYVNVMSYRLMKMAGYMLSTSVQSKMAKLSRVWHTL